MHSNAKEDNFIVFCILVFAWLTVYGIKRFESKKTWITLISIFILIFSLFKLITFYLKKTVCVVNVPPKYSLGIFFINSILFGFDIYFYFKYLLSSNRFFPTQIDIDWN